MKDRTAWALIGVLAVVCLGVVLSAVYPFTTAEPHASNPPNERFDVGDADAYRANGTILADGEVALAFDGVMTADGAWYQRVVDGDVVTETYQAASKGPIYNRVTMPEGEDADRRRELIAEAEQRELLREDREGDDVTFVVAENGSGSPEEVSGTASVFVNSLSLAGYESDDTGSPDETVYEPRPGWYDGTRTYRLTAVSGEVRADSDTNAVESANVSWELSVHAGTYAEYALARVVDDGTTTQRITFEYEPSDPDLERPGWADGADST